jgi:type I restriction enzyme, S subunit
MREWQVVPFIDAIDLIGGGTPKTNVPEYWDGNIPWLSVVDFNHGLKYVAQTEKHISKLGLQNSSTKTLSKGDIILSARGTVGAIAILDREMAFNQSCYGIKAKCELAINDFIFYALKNAIKDFQRIAHGAVFDTITRSTFENIYVALPPLPEQKAITAVLGALDDKIELNRRMNATLEDMARALFKSWFVDFDPVRAKMEGKQPFGMDAAIAALFPSSLGEIPESWTDVTLEKIAALNPETWGKNNRPDNIQYVDLANTKWGSIESTAPYAWKDAPSRAQRILRPGDTIVGTVRPGNGSFSFVNVNGLTGSTGFAVLRPKKPIYREILYYIATSKDNIDRLSHLADGAAYPAVRPDVVLNTPFIFPGEEIVSAFSAQTAHILDRVEVNKQENKALAELRDYLLPKLISGDIRIPDVEKFLEAA